MEKIISTKNAKVKQLKKLHSAKGRKEAGRYLLEGEHLYTEAQVSRETILEVYVTEKYLAKWEEQGDSPLLTTATLVSDEVMKALSQTETPQGILCVMPVPSEELQLHADGKYVLLDGIQDPGNAGTIVRTADAAGYDAVIFGNGSADPYNDKVVRSMQGSQFHIDLYRKDLLAVIPLLKEKGVPVYGTALDEGAADFREVAQTKAVALVLGNEGNGVSPEVLAQTDRNLYIPIIGQAESLNVAVAGGILLYHFL